MTETIDFFKDIAPPTISLIVTSIISLSIGVYLEKFKNRLTFIKYKISYESIATANYNDYWGKIEVFYNDRKTNHLNFITIYLTNDSNRDFKDLYVDLRVDNSSSIKGSHAYYIDSEKLVLLEQTYYDGLINVIEKEKIDSQKKEENPEYQTPLSLQDEINYYQRNQKYYLPVFNRDSEIRLNILVENFEAKIPKVNIDIKHIGLKLIEEEDKYVMERKSGITAIIYGLSIFIIIAIGLGFIYPGSLTPIIILGIVGALYIIIGAFISKPIQSILNYFK
jgi:hypothetical protein